MPLNNNEREFRKVLLESIFEHSNDAIMSGDLSGNFTSWNPAAEQIYGYSAHEMIGQNILRLVPPEYEEQLDELRVKIFGGTLREVHWHRRLIHGDELYKLVLSHRLESVVEFSLLAKR